MRRKAAVGSDDLYAVAEFLAKELERRGFEVIRVGYLKEGRPVPWPLVGFEVGEAVAEGRADFGVVVCYTGTGVSIAANKVKGVRAALCFDAETAKGARLWNDSNVLAISARLTSDIVAKEILDAWLSVKAPDASEEGNINMVKDYERRGDR